MIVVVSHADVIKLVLAHYLGVHIDLFQRIGLAPASVSLLALSDKAMVRVLRINDDGPIQPPPPPPEKKASKKSKKAADPAGVEANQAQPTTSEEAATEEET
jgi:probable phosphoglycerate mutase